MSSRRNRRLRGASSSKRPCRHASEKKLSSYSSASSKSSSRGSSSSNRSSSNESSSYLSSERTQISSSKSIGSVLTVGAECNMIAPDMTINDGDRKAVYELADKGKLVVIHRTDGTMIYMLRCVDGRRVYIEKGKEGASLMLTNPRGRIIKVLAGQY